VGIHWPALDEDISVEGLLHGRRSGESDASFERWLNSRRRPANRRLQPDRVTIDGCTVELRVMVRDSFGEDAFRVEFRRI
jgi:hypothetical protein